jgi:hypothetical protein
MYYPHDVLIRDLQEEVVNSTRVEPETATSINDAIFVDQNCEVSNDPPAEGVGIPDLHLCNMIEYNGRRRRHCRELLSHYTDEQQSRFLGVSRDPQDTVDPRFASCPSSFAPTANASSSSSICASMSGGVTFF